MAWGETVDGKRIPLDPIAPVYKVVNTGLSTRVERAEGSYMVSHFSTCSQANKFSSSKKTTA